MNFSILHTKKGTLLSLGNARRRHLHRAAKAIGVKIGGGQDFWHATNRMMRRIAVDQVVRPDLEYQIHVSRDAGLSRQWRIDRIVQLGQKPPVCGLFASATVCAAELLSGRRTETATTDNPR
jgi:hypothetical protein